MTSTRFNRVANAVSSEAPLILLEINHPTLAEPVRIVNDVQDVISQGNNYIACPFRVALPDDQDQQYPQARLQIDNVGRELTYWLEQSRGGDGATCRLVQVLRDYPDDWEADYLLNLTGLSVDQLTVSGTLSFTNPMDLPAVGMQYRPETVPELF